MGRQPLLVTAHEDWLDPWGRLWLWQGCNVSATSESLITYGLKENWSSMKWDRNAFQVGYEKARRSNIVIDQEFKGIHLWNETGLN